MGWGKWFSFGSGEVREKTESTPTGGTREQYLHTSGEGGSRRNHDHVVVNKNSSGKITSAHSAGKKDSRPK
jgi:hypothetical protein